MSTTETQAAPRTAADVPPSRAEDVVWKLAEQVGARVAASTVFGTPVEREGVTVIPVAGARFAFGGGAGESKANDQEGSGGGAAGMLSPRGYIEVKDGRSRFVPAVEPARMFALMLAATLGALAIMRPLLQERLPARRSWRRA